MKHIYTIILLCITLAMPATAQNYQWLQRAGGNGVHSSTGLGTNGQGNVYVSGNIDDSITIGNISYKSTEGWFIAKYTLEGEVEWARIISSGTSTASTADYEGNTYICGYFTDSLVFDSATIYSKGARDIFIAAFDTAGYFKWARPAGGDEDDEASAITVDAIGNPYITGYFRRNASFGSSLLTSVGGSDAFVAKYDTAGNYIWGRKGGGQGFDMGTGISANVFGEVFVTGTYNKEALFDKLKVNSTGGSDIFIARYNNQGLLQWLNQAGGFGDDSVSSIAINGAGYSCITGSYNATAGFDEITISSQGGTDIFIAQYSPAGKALWAKTAGGTADGDKGLAVAADGGGNVYVTGRYKGEAAFEDARLNAKAGFDIFLAKYDFAGKKLWAYSAGSNADDAGTSICLNSKEIIYLGGEISGNASFAGNTVPGEAGGTYFIASISQDASAIQEREDIQYFQVYPNPAAANVHIRSASPDVHAHINVTDMQGRLVVNGLAMRYGQADLRTEDWANGLYLVQMWQSQKLSTFKLLIQH